MKRVALLYNVNSSLPSEKPLVLQITYILVCSLILPQEATQSHLKEPMFPGHADALCLCLVNRYYDKQLIQSSAAD